MVQSYEDLLAAAEARETAAKAKFDAFDLDGSGTIDTDELMLLMEDLGLLKSMTTSAERTKFLTQTLCEFDNGDAQLTFEEFKPFYNAAKDKAAGKKPKAVSRTKSGLSDDQNAARRKLHEEKMAKKAEEAEKVRKQNEEMKAKLAAKGAGGSTSLSADTNKKRVEFLKQKKAEKAAKEAKLKAENRAMSQKIKNTAARTDDDIDDDEKAGGGTMGDARKGKAQEGRDKLASREADYKQREKDLKKMKSTTGARVDDDIDDDELAGGGTMGDARQGKAQEGRDKLASREADYKQRERDLKKMKSTTGARVDDDLGDDELEGGGTMGELRADIGLKH